MSDGDILAKGKENKAKLEKSMFKQQTLSEWRPNPTMVTTLITFLIFGAIFLSLGILLVELAKNITEVTLTYHEKCVNQDELCTVDLEITKKMEHPIYVYYELDNFYQNHRRYVKSRSNSQLKGSYLEVDDISSCSPITTMADLGKTETIDGTQLDGDVPAHPCGLIAKSFFNEKYELKLGDTRIDINEKGIAWETDKNDLFKNGGSDYKSKQWQDVTDEHFIVWMRVAGFSTFKKPWGKIEQDLEPGTYTLIITDLYDVSSFDGKKKFFLSTTESYGGKNTFLAV
jgi:hypothetical protein